MFGFICLRMSEDCLLKTYKQAHVKHTLNTISRKLQHRQFLNHEDMMSVA